MTVCPAGIWQLADPPPGAAQSPIFTGISAREGVCQFRKKVADPPPAPGQRSGRRLDVPPPSPSYTERELFGPRQALMEVGDEIDGHFRADL